MKEVSDFPTPLPGVEGILWPAIPYHRASMILSLLFQLEQSQWWAPERIQAAQFRQAAELLRHARRTVPYYAKRLDNFTWRYGQPLTSEIWSELPLLRREDIQDAGELLHSRALPKSHGKTMNVSTSGSTGKPVTVLSSEITSMLWNVFTARDYIWRRWDISGKLAAIRHDRSGRSAYPDGSNGKSWVRSLAAALPTGPSAMLSIATPIESQIEWLQRKRPDYLITHPTNLEALLLHCAREGIRISNLKQVQTISEVLNADVRPLCQEVWGVVVSDMYTTQEAGYLALQCPLHEHYHIQSENVIIEILDAQDKPCAPGQTGRVVVTHLHNFATPLIRYDIGDYAEMGVLCSCGRGLPVINHIAGRARAMVILPSGDQHWPFFGGVKFSHIAPISQFQLVQKTLDTIEAILVTARELTESEQNELRQLITTELTYPFMVTFTYVDEIPRSKGGKYEEFRSEVAMPRATS